MKKLSKRLLAVLLAALMLAAVAPAADAIGGNKSGVITRALPPGPVEGEVDITTPGANTGEVYYDSWDDTYYLYRRNLSGLVFEASEGRLETPVTVDYDTVTASGYWKPIEGRIVWEFSLYLDWDAQPEGWKIGSNAALLRIWGYEFTNYTYVETFEGVDYGTLDQEHVFYAQVPVTLNCTKYFNIGLDTGSATPLELDVPAPVHIAAGYYDELEEKYIYADPALFSFMPEEDGWYCFKSSGAKYGQELYSPDGDYRWNGVDPWAELYDEDGGYLTYSDDDYSNEDHRWNFGIYRQLEAGKTYYLLTSCDRWNGGDYEVVVVKSTGKPPEPPDEGELVALPSITIPFRSYINITALLEGTTWDLYDLYYDCDGDVVRDEWYGDIDHCLYGARCGTALLYIEAPDGSGVTVEVTVKYSFLQWVSLILFAGWYWMPYMAPGEFNFMGLVEGIADSLGVVIGFLLAVIVISVSVLAAMFQTFIIGALFSGAAVAVVAGGAFGGLFLLIGIISLITGAVL